MHTPGPWLNDDQIIRSATVEIADVYGNSDGCATANARLIAAAPNMMELLELVADWETPCADGRSLVQTQQEHCTLAARTLLARIEAP